MSFQILFRTITTKLLQGQHVHTCCQRLAAEKSLLMKLRKSTGYTFINCKKALEKFDNDIEQAESWLNQQAKMEGWSKATKLEGRKAKDGLVGVFVGQETAVMVEVNCETDFVARNEKFQQLVKDAVQATLAHHRSKDQTGFVKSMLEGNELSQLSVGESGSLADQVALTIGRLGENMTVRRAVRLGVPSGWHIGSYVHGGVGVHGDVALGRYGALVVLKGGQEESLGALGRKLAQHVVGEAPQTLGNAEDLPCGDSETRLLPQAFLLDPSRTVAQFLQGQEARVLDFVRFQCGEA